MRKVPAPGLKHKLSLSAVLVKDEVYGVEDNRFIMKKLSIIQADRENDKG